MAEISDREQGRRLMEKAHDRIVAMYNRTGDEALVRAIGEMDRAFFLLFPERTVEL